MDAVPPDLDSDSDAEFEVHQGVTGDGLLVMASAAVTEMVDYGPEADGDFTPGNMPTMLMASEDDQPSLQNPTGETFAQMRRNME